MGVFVELKMGCHQKDTVNGVGMVMADRGNGWQWEVMMEFGITQSLGLAGRTNFQFLCLSGSLVN
jgi:hypothetical protein